MRDRPEAPVLAALADALAAMAPDLREERRVEPALLARARAIAERERAAGDAPVAACHRALIALLGEGGFDALFQRLAQQIRAGAYDAAGAERDRVLQLLWAVTLQKLRESNPDYLAASGVEKSPRRR
jgi:hypothetical protein